MAMLLPFAAMLLCIALLPAISKYHWERNYHFVALGLAAIPCGYYLLVGQPARLLPEFRDYLSFIILVGAFFVVTGGMHIAVRRHATALTNVLFLLGGGLSASLIGTTGASVLLIRPWMRLNRERYRGFHTVFFLFLVSNIGGGLTPIGQAPLLLGYLKGVPFWWPAQHCWLPWLITFGWLLFIFLAFDLIDRRLRPVGPRRAAGASELSTVRRFQGRRNLWFLALILASFFVHDPPFLREILMLIAAVAAYYFTPKSIRAANAFTFQPLREVAWLFLGIFATMAPVLDYLQFHAREISMTSASQYFWTTGWLSSLLDNAPTYLLFFSAALGHEGLNIDAPADVVRFLGQEPAIVAAITMGSVIFGALTYIGNGPNILVKATVEEHRLAPPGFFAYILQYSLPVFLPVIVLIWLTVFR